MYRPEEPKALADIRTLEDIQTLVRDRAESLPITAGGVWNQKPFDVYGTEKL